MEEKNVYVETAAAGYELAAIRKAEEQAAKMLDPAEAVDAWLDIARAWADRAARY